MKKVSILKLVAFAILIAGLATVAEAQATRTWVSGVGDDANPCSRTAPCKTFAGAISKTATGGEISALDPGGFGAVTITKGITINGDGTLASILNSLVNGVIVNITTNPSTSTVYLRNLSINGAQNGLDGVRILSAGTVVVENCWIYGSNATNTSDGIEVAAAAATNLKVNNTTIEDFAGDCIEMNTSIGQVVAMISNSRLQNCATGAIHANSRVRAGISNTVMSHGTTGVRATGTDNQLNLDDVFVAFFTTGIQSIAGSTIRLSDSTITQNGTGISLNGGIVDSFQGNSLMGNPTPGSFSSTTLKQ
jgi:hypothetical protein